MRKSLQSRGRQRCLRRQAQKQGKKEFDKLDFIKIKSALQKTP